MSQQIAVRIPDDMATELKQLVDDGRFDSVADAIRAGARELIRRQRERDIDAAITAGYRRFPPSAAEERWADRAGRELIAEEPW